MRANQRLYFPLESQKVVRSVFRVFSLSLPHNTKRIADVASYSTLVWSNRRII